MTTTHKLINEELKKGDAFKLNGMKPATLVKLISTKYGVSPQDFVKGKGDTIVYQPKKVAKPKTKVVSKPEDMSVEEYKAKYVLPMKPELKDEEGEEWRPVENKNRYFGGDVDYGNYYEISNLGRLRTINLQNAAKSSISVGYDAPTRKAMQFHLNHKSGMNTCPDVKYMVADAFLGEHDLQDNMVIHIDGDYHNNRADNLKWVPRKKNKKVNKTENMNINEQTYNMIRESVKKALYKKLNEAYQERYENAIETIEYYLNMCENGKQLSDEQYEQLSEIVDWLKETDASDNPNLQYWVEAAENLMNQKVENDAMAPVIEKKQSGIHINPENKGKFTATKKRTGKTTSELLHSKNPLTRQRANFARNAAKWAKNKKKSVDENLLSKIIREALDNFTQENEPQTQGMSQQKPSWEEILKRINDAGVNQAIPRGGKSQTNTQTSSSQHVFKIGNYTFNYAQHRLDGPNGTEYMNGRMSDMLAMFCENMGEPITAQSLLENFFGVTEMNDKAKSNLKFYMSKLASLFKGDPNVKFVGVRGVGYRLDVNE